MADSQPIQPELFDVAELPGWPMLHWHGKRPLREIPYYPAQLRERYGPHPTPPAPSPLSQDWERGEGVPRPEGAAGVRGEGWVNRLYWGDNLQVMAHLMREFRGQVKLIYIDPAYDGEVFHARITDTPARRDELVRGEYAWEATEYGDGPVAVKIVDVLRQSLTGSVREMRSGLGW